MAPSLEAKILLFADADADETGAVNVVDAWLRRVSGNALRAVGINAYEGAVLSDHWPAVVRVFQQTDWPHPAEAILIVLIEGKLVSLVRADGLNWGVAGAARVRAARGS